MKTKRSKKLTLKDRLSRLTYVSTRQLLGENGKQLLQWNGTYDDIDIDRDVYLGDDLTDVDAFRAIHAACHDSDFQGFAIGITSQEMPEKLTEEADFTLDGVNDVERFLKWVS